MEQASFQAVKTFSSEISVGQTMLLLSIGCQASMFVVRECDHTHRHHLHIIMEKPDDIELNFMHMVKSCWQKTKFGYSELHFEIPDNLQRIVGWLEYCLKKRTKNDLASSIDWVNSTCFELR